MRSHRNGEAELIAPDADRRGRQVPRKAPRIGQETYGSDHAGRHRHHHHWKLLSPARRRAAVAFLQRRHRVSQRRACGVVGQGRSTQRYVIVASDFEARLVKQVHVHAAAHPRWGYRKIHALLVADGWAVNHKQMSGCGGRKV